MKLFVLTNTLSSNTLSESGYIGENEPKIFTNYDDVFTSMETSYDSIVNNDSDVQESSIGNIDAYITHKDGQVESYRIWEVEV